MTEAKFLITIDSIGEFRFNLHSRGNFKIILRSSEGYKTRQGCINGIQSVKENSPFDSKYHRDKASNGLYYFVLKAANGEPLGISELYTTMAEREEGISAVKRDAPGAKIE